jgi:inorganic pyrophosphatase
VIRDLIDVIVEIPAGCRNKYEFDHEGGLIRLVRQLPPSLVYPGEYGFMPGTYGQDGDPLDVLVLIEEPTDLPARLLDEIEHFFLIYKDLEPDKNARTCGYSGRAEARHQIVESVERFARRPVGVGA